MKPGDLVRILYELHSYESGVGIFIGDFVDFNVWGYLPVVDCTLFWMGELIPFEKAYLELINKLNETE